MIDIDYHNTSASAQLISIVKEVIGGPRLAIVWQKQIYKNLCILYSAVKAC